MLTLLVFIVYSLASLNPSSAFTMSSGKFQFCIDRGGTFTDVHCILPNGQHVVRKLLSEDPHHYPDAPTEGIRRLLDEFGTDGPYPRGVAIRTHEIGSIRMGTTVATNALLERKGSPLALITTKGFGDLLEIGNQSRPNIFDLSCSKPSLLYKTVVEVDERVVLNQFYPANSLEGTVVQGLTGEEVRILKEPDLDQVQKDLQRLKEEGIEALAVCLMHSYTFAEHEKRIGKIAEDLQFPQISLSHEVMPMVKMVSR
jgi:5-oxoprolinase (ATP-hydrolysing)